MHFSDYLTGFKNLNFVVHFLMIKDSLYIVAINLFKDETINIVFNMKLGEYSVHAATCHAQEGE